MHSNAMFDSLLPSYLVKASQSKMQGAASEAGDSHQPLRNPKWTDPLIDVANSPVIHWTPGTKTWWNNPGGLQQLHPALRKILSEDCTSALQAELDSNFLSGAMCKKLDKLAQKRLGDSGETCWNCSWLNISWKSMDIMDLETSQPWDGLRTEKTRTFDEDGSVSPVTSRS